MLILKTLTELLLELKSGQLNKKIDTIFMANAHYYVIKCCFPLNNYFPYLLSLAGLSCA